MREKEGDPETQEWFGHRGCHSSPWGPMLLHPALEEVQRQSVPADLETAKMRLSATERG